MSAIFSQENLVPNGSFEDSTTSTPNLGMGYYEICAGWHNASYGTIDYYSSHCEQTPSGDPGLCVPQSFIGYQEAKSGVAYAGFVLYEHVFPEINPECMQGQLIQALAPDQFYEFKFYLTLANSSVFKTCNLDVFFESQNLYCTNCLPPLTKYASFDISNVDSLEWHEFSFVFQATGGEQYVYFSNYDSADEGLSCEVEQEVLDISYNSAYYFFDEVSLVKVSESNLQDLEFSNVLSPNGDGRNDSFFIPKDQYGRLLENVNFSIYNRWGHLIFEGDKQSSWDGTSGDGSICPEGVYFLRVQQLFYEQELQKTGFIHLIR